MTSFFLTRSQGLLILKSTVASILAAAVCIALVEPAVAQFPTPEVTSLSQSVAQVGSRVQITPKGAQLDELRAIWSSQTKVQGTPVKSTQQSLLRSQSATSFGNGSFETSIDQVASPGLCELRFQGRFGISNPRRFLITKNPVKLLASASNHSSTANEIQPGVIWSTKCAPKTYQTLTLHVQQGDQLRLVAYAKPIDSQAIPAVIALDSKQNELGRARAIQDWPAELELVAPESGMVTFKLYDFLFRGGEEYECLFEVGASAEGDSDEDLELNQLLRPTLNPEHKSLISVDPTRIAAEVPVPDESNALTEPLSVPFVVNGSFHEKSQFSFRAEKGQTICLEVVSSQLGQLTDPYLAIFRDAPSPDKRALAFVDDSASFGGPEMRIRLRDPYVTWKAPDNGIYRVHLFDNNQGKRPTDSLQFTLLGRPPSPGGHVLAYHGFPNNNRNVARPRGIHLMRGGTTEIKLAVLRKDGCNSTLKIAAENLPKGVSCISTLVMATSQEASLILEAEETAQAWTGPLQLTVASEDETDSSNIRLLTGTVAAAANPTRNSISSRLCEELMLSVSELDLAPVFVSAKPGTHAQGNPKESIEVPIQVTRRDGGNGECLLRAKDLPPGCSCPDVKIPGDKSEGKLSFKIGEKTPPGEYTFWLQNETKVKWKRNPQALEREEKALAELQSHKEKPDAKSFEAEVARTRKRIEELKKSTAPKDLTVWLPSRPIKIQILANNK